MEVKYREEQVITSPYVTQADKMAVSLRHLADRFLKMEPAFYMVRFLVVSA